MNSTGFITLHRSIVDSWLWDLPPIQTKIAIQLIFRANWGDGKMVSGGKVIHIPRGSFVGSYPRLADTFGVSVQTLRTTFRNLEAGGFLTRRPTCRFTMFTIVNYRSYQDKDAMPNTLSNRQPTGEPTGNQQANQQTTNNDRTREQGNKGTREQGSARKRAHALPDSWEPTDKHREKASAIGVDADTEADSFRDHHLAKGSVMKDWNRAFNTWLRNAERFANERQAKQPSRQVEVML